MDKTQFIADLKNGQVVASLVLLASSQQGQARNGPFWKLELRDNTGSIEAKIWSPQSQAHTELPPGCIAEIKGRVGSYRERLEIAVDTLRLLSPEQQACLDISQFMAASARSPEVMLEELRSLGRAHFSHSPWRKLILGILESDEISALMPLAPAAKGMHHAYAGGLLEHTLSVARVCLILADHYPFLDKQVLLAGAICHDLGKLWELRQGLATEYTTPGRLLGHMQQVLDFLEPRLKKSGLEEDLALHLKHLILSHHGSHEFGSSRLPATAEAFVLHYADNIDAKLNQVQTALSCVPEGETGWSPYNPGLERFLFRAPASPAKDKKRGRSPAPAEPGQTGQLSLLIDPLPDGGA